jgi:hypothetical protein
MNEKELIKSAQVFRAEHMILPKQNSLQIAVGQIRVLQHRQNFKLASIYVLVLEVRYDRGAVRVAAIDPDIFYATPSDIVISHNELKSPFNVALIPTLTSWVEFAQLIEGEVRAQIDPILLSELFSVEGKTDRISAEKLIGYGFQYGEIEIQPGDHAWLNRSLLVETFHEFTVSLVGIKEFSTEPTTSWLYSNYYSKIDSYQTLFATIPSEILNSDQGSFNIDQERLMDMQIRGSLELQLS